MNNYENVPFSSAGVESRKRPETRRRENLYPF